MKTSCIVVAAGSGKRAGFSFNKVFYELAGRTVLFRSLDALSSSGLIDEIVPVISPVDALLYAETLRREGASPIVRDPVPGGKTRRESVYAGLKALDPDTDVVLVHDAARPFVTKEIIENVLKDALMFSSGVISCPVTDTVKQLDGENGALCTLDRNLLRTVQTPQAFRYDLLLKAHETLPEDEMATDDAYLFEKLYGSVHLTGAASAKKNIKLTTAEDFEMAENLLSPPLRTGTGYDVHRLVPGRRLVLCGVEIPCEKGLLGHSDADVALHALIDAMLGAAALGDIGHMFPDSDQKYKDISSLALLKTAAQAVQEAGYELSNCDITIVCQKPKLAPYIAQMRAVVADALGASPDCVSVKATTTEGLGFEGEGLGISAQSIAVIKRRNQCRK